MAVSDSPLEDGVQEKGPSECSIKLKYGDVVRISTWTENVQVRAMWDGVSIQ